MVLTFAGKCEPSLEKIKAQADLGFKFLEVYVNEQMYKMDIAAILLEAKKKYGINFCSIHTPHVDGSKFEKYLKQTIEITKKVGIPTIVFHSAFVKDISSDDILSLIKPGMVIENNPDTPLEKLTGVLRRGFKICLDFDHLYIASFAFNFDFYAEAENLFENFPNGIKHIHLADASKQKDNLAIGEGELDHARILKILQKFYSGIVVIETPVETKKEDLKKILRYIS